MASTPQRVSIDLRGVRFSEKEGPLLSVGGGLAVSAFVYSSGVAALRVTTGRGEIIVLPFHGQQIWDARFDGRRLTMNSMFEEPSAITQYARNYGGFLLHCGVSGLGSPGTGDRHAVHGELPHAQYARAELALGEDAQGVFAEISGTYRHTEAFKVDFEFTPTLRLRSNSGRIEATIRLRNRRNRPMDFLYMGHINFRPVDGARIVDTVADIPSRQRVRRRQLEITTATQQHLKFLDRLDVDPGSHRLLEGGWPIDPALSLSLTPHPDANGWSHAMQVLPDGSADFVSVRPDEFDHCSRWLVRNGHEDALGLLLPATAEADGYEAELAKGNVRRIDPGGEFSARYMFGALTAGEVPTLMAQIEEAHTRAGGNSRTAANDPAV